MGLLAFFASLFCVSSPSFSHCLLFREPLQLQPASRMTFCPILLLDTSMALYTCPWRKPMPVPVSLATVSESTLHSIFHFFLPSDTLLAAAASRLNASDGAITDASQQRTRPAAHEKDVAYRFLLLLRLAEGALLEMKAVAGSGKLVFSRAWTVRGTEHVRPGCEDLHPLACFPSLFRSSAVTFWVTGQPGACKSPRVYTAAALPLLLSTRY